MQYQPFVYGEPRKCECGCGKEFISYRWNRIYASESCTVRNRSGKPIGKWSPPSEPISCACGCGVTFTPLRRVHIYASFDCSYKTRGLREKTGRVRRVGPPTFKGVELIRQLAAETPEGLCIYCEEELSGLQRFTCADAECQRSYMRDWRAGVRLAQKREKDAAAVTRKCHLRECSADFLPQYTGQIYCCAEHRKSARRRPGTRGGNG